MPFTVLQCVNKDIIMKKKLSDNIHQRPEHYKRRIVVIIQSPKEHGRYILFTIY